MSDTFINQTPADQIGTLNSPTASIVYGTVDFSDTPSLDGDGLWADPATANSGLDIFTDYLIEMKYEKDREKWVLPLTSPTGFNGSSIAVVQLAAPTLILIVDWTAARTNVCPEVLDPTSLGDRYVLLDDHYEPAQLGVAADGITPLYRISGTYFYAVKDPQDTTFSDVNFPRPPYLQDVFTRTVPTDKIVSDLAVMTAAQQPLPDTLTSINQ